mmetsp:Transcript_22956/g.48414  ORF Transcript_22956/g.48414 Transcript_22956/m.48414 type:complete len:351 (-) Transcript_22956:155-1207(-)
MDCTIATCGSAGLSPISTSEEACIPVDCRFIIVKSSATFSFSSGEYSNGASDDSPSVPSCTPPSFAILRDTLKFASYISSYLSWFSFMVNLLTGGNSFSLSTFLGGDSMSVVISLTVRMAEFVDAFVSEPTSFSFTFSPSASSLKFPPMRKPPSFIIKVSSLFASFVCGSTVSISSSFPTLGVSALALMMLLILSMVDSFSVVAISSLGSPELLGDSWALGSVSSSCSSSPNNFRKVGDSLPFLGSGGRYFATNSLALLPCTYVPAEKDEYPMLFLAELTKRHRGGSAMNTRFFPGEGGGDLGASTEAACSDDRGGGGALMVAMDACCLTVANAISTFSIPFSPLASAPV